MSRARSGKEKSTIVAGTGMMAAVWVAIRAGVLKRGGTDELIYDKLNSEAEAPPIIEKIVDLIVGKAVAVVAQVAWGLIFPWIIAVCRFVSFTDPNITAENFPPQPDDFRIKEVVIVKIYRWMSTDEILQLLAGQGLRVATLIELLWWWLTHPAEQANCLVVALGSVWGDFSPYVYGRGGNRCLDLDGRSRGWGSGYTFAAVRK